MSEPACSESAIPWQQEEWDGANGCWKALYPSEVAKGEPDGNKNTTEKEFLDKLVADHWDYISQVLSTRGIEDYELNEIGFHYRTAMVHGWKHCAEYHGLPTC